MLGPWKSHPIQPMVLGGRGCFCMLAPLSLHMSLSYPTCGLTPYIPYHPTCSLNYMPPTSHASKPPEGPLLHPSGPRSSVDGRGSMAGDAQRRRAMVPRSYSGKEKRALASHSDHTCAPYAISSLLLTPSLRSLSPPGAPRGLDDGGAYGCGGIRTPWGDPCHDDRDDQQGLWGQWGKVAEGSCGG